MPQEGDYVNIENSMLPIGSDVGPRVLTQKRFYVRQSSAHFIRLIVRSTKSFWVVGVPGDGKTVTVLTAASVALFVTCVAHPLTQ